MKKAISCLTALTVCAAALAGCSSGASPAGQGAILNFGTGAVAVRITRLWKPSPL